MTSQICNKEQIRRGVQLRSAPKPTIKSQTQGVGCVVGESDLQQQQRMQQPQQQQQQQQLPAPPHMQYNQQEQFLNPHQSTLQRRDASHRYE